MKFIKNRFSFVICFVLLIITSCNIEPFEDAIIEGENLLDTNEPGTFKVDFDG